MQLKRVVITGMGAVSPLGKNTEALFSGLAEGKSGVRHAPELSEVGDLRPQVAGLVADVDPKVVPRKFRRAMSLMSVYTVLAAQEALDAGDVDEESRTSGRLGIAVGSTMGSVDTMEEFFASYLKTRSIAGTRSTTFFRVVGHSCAANAAQYFGITGRVLAPSSACSTGLQAVGLGYEAIALGRQDMMLCGGADEFNALTAGTFDVFQAASHSYNDAPDQTPRPFDKDRDGIVCSEGAGVLLLESLDSALERGADILCEITGFSSMADPSNIASPDHSAILSCMSKALEDAGMRPADIDYVNAHATGTLAGDAAEAQAVGVLFGPETPVSSLKGNLGHTMAASGALELAACVNMMREGRIFPTRNLMVPSTDCTNVRHILKLIDYPINAVLKNSFALGGVNTSLVIKRYGE